MKKHILLLSGTVLFLALSTNYAKAQAITITQADVPNIWEQAVMAVDATGSFAPQAASPTAQIWNYAALGNTQTNTYQFTNPSTTPYYSAFHASNLADSLVYGSGYTYFSSTPTAFSGVGYGENKYGYSIGLALHPYYTQIPLPATYGTIDGGISKGDSTMAINYMGLDSGRVIMNIRYADTVDAFGTMKTPYGTQDVIRQKHYDVAVDTIFVHAPFLGWYVYETEHIISYTYRWYAKGLGYYFAIMQMDHTNTKDSVVQWLNGGNLGVNTITTSNYTSVYPNPCQTQITFNCPSPQARQVSVFDITGRQIATQEMNNGMTIINTSSCPAGMYFYRIADASGNVLDRGKFIVQ